MLTFCYDFDSIATSPCFLSQGVSIDVCISSEHSELACLFSLMVVGNRSSHHLH